MGLNVYSLLQDTEWYQFGLNSVVNFSTHLTRGLFMDNDHEYNTNSKTSQTLLISFGFTIVSFIFSAIIFLICIVGFFKHTHKHARKFIFTGAVITLICNIMACLLFLRINRSICNDLTDDLIVLPEVFNNAIRDSNVCKHFRGSTHNIGLGTIYWKPSAGWICTVVASVISIPLIAAASNIVRSKKLGYHIIH
eukprot:gene3457-3931_t